MSDEALSGCGIGLPKEHHDLVLSTRPDVPFFEVISEDFMGNGGRPRDVDDPENVARLPLVRLSRLERVPPEGLSAFRQGGVPEDRGRPSHAVRREEAGAGGRGKKGLTALRPDRRTRTRSMLTCRELIEFLSDYTSGALTPGERARFDEHLAVCPSCVAYLSQYETTVRLGHGAFPDGDAPAEEAPPDLIRAVLEARKRSG